MNKHKPPISGYQKLTDVTGYGDLILRRAEALRSLGNVVYAVRCGDVIKVGHTSNLAKRVNSLKADEVLAFLPGSKADEQVLHERLADHRHHAREWYYPTPGVMAVVNEMREAIGLDPIAA